MVFAAPAEFLAWYSQYHHWKKRRLVTGVKLGFEYFVGTSKVSCETCIAFLIILDIGYKCRPVVIRAPENS